MLHYVCFVFLISFQMFQLVIMSPIVRDMLALLVLAMIDVDYFERDACFSRAEIFLSFCRVYYFESCENIACMVHVYHSDIL